MLADVGEVNEVMGRSWDGAYADCNEDDLAAELDALDDGSLGVPEVAAPPTAQPAATAPSSSFVPYAVPAAPEGGLAGGAAPTAYPRVGVKL